jgi:protease I
MPEFDLKGTKVLMVIAYHDFRDEEYQKPREILENAGAEITVASSSTGPALGKLGMTVNVDTLLEDILVEDYDAFVFVGGPGASEYFNNQTALRIVKQADEAHKIIAAICIAPVILANAGILTGKEATVFSTEAYTLREKGVIYTGQEVETDGMGNIITADGPEAAEKFANLIAEALVRAKARK